MLEKKNQPVSVMAQWLKVLVQHVFWKFVSSIPCVSSFKNPQINVDQGPSNKKDTQNMVMSVLQDMAERIKSIAKSQLELQTVVN